MGILSGLASLFSSNADTQTKAESADSIEYNGFTITPTPIPEGGQFRLSATITKPAHEMIQTHTFIRSDVIASRDDCIEMTIRKAKIAIDQMGEKIFD